jgi:hypothetical protein
MLTAAKAFWLAFGVYFLSIFVGAFFLKDQQQFPQEIFSRTLLACSLFLVGLAIGALLFPFPVLPDAASDPDYRQALLGLVALTVGISIYVAVAGPRAPFFQSFSLTDPDAIMYAREDALKLNSDRIFVRLYSWGRDIFGPVTFALSLHWLRRPGNGRDTLGYIGLLAASYLALWSGQKATLVLYLIAAFVFTASNVRTMLVTAFKAAPVLLALVAWLFWITLPQLVGNPEAMTILSQSIVNRVFGTLKVAMAYVDAIDRMHTIAHADVIPYMSFLWSPDILTVENFIGIEYFTSNTLSSIHANGPAFAYAYVLGGHAGAFIGGLAVMALLRVAFQIVRRTGSSFLGVAFSSSVCYMLLDLVNGNFMGYTLKVVALALLVWGAHALLPRRSVLGVGDLPSTT